MSSTVFVDKVTHVPADWANDVNTLVYGILNGAQTKAEVRDALELGSLALQSSNTFEATEGLMDGVVIGGSDPKEASFTQVTLVGNAVLQDDSLVPKSFVVDAISSAIQALGTLSGQESDSVTLTGGNIDGVTVGLTSAAEGRFTTLRTTNLVPSDDQDVVPLKFLNDWIDTLPTFGDLASMNKDEVELTGGYIDGTVIGEDEASTGRFTEVRAPKLVAGNQNSSGASVYLGSKTGKADHFFWSDGVTSTSAGFGIGSGGRFSIQGPVEENLIRVLSDGRVLIGDVTPVSGVALQVGGDISADRVTLAEPPSSGAHAVNKQYVDTAVTALVDSLSSISTAYSELGTMSTQNKDSVDITGGEINGVVIGNDTPGTARFTNITTNLIGNSLSGGLVSFEAEDGYAVTISSSGEFNSSLLLSIQNSARIDFKAGGSLLASLTSQGVFTIGDLEADAFSRLQVDGGLTVHGEISFGGTKATGVTANTLGNNSPAITPGIPFTWVRVRIDNDLCWMPVWK